MVSFTLAFKPKGGMNLHLLENKFHNQEFENILTPPPKKNNQTLKYEKSRVDFLKRKCNCFLSFPFSSIYESILQKCL